jgi:hypothetical protein
VPWGKWLYTARVTTTHGRTLEFGVRANNAKHAERLTRSWTEQQRLDVAAVTVAISVREGRTPGALRERLGRLTMPEVRVYEPGEVPSGMLDQRDGASIYREPAATEADIADAEQRLGVGLPQPYRDFLGWSNGGQTKSGVVLLPVQQLFLVDEEALDHEQAWLLTIGLDDAGDLVCLSPSGDVLMAHHDPPGVDPLAASFDNWLRESSA